MNDLTRQPVRSATQRMFKPSLMALALAAALGTAHAQSGITDLGNMGGRYSYAYGVSNNGSVVVGTYDDLNNIPQAFRWTSSGVTQPVLPAGASRSILRGVSSNGSVSVGSYTDSSSKEHAFSWTSSGVAEFIELSGGSSGANAVSADGTATVGWSASASTRHAVRWTGNTVTDLHPANTAGFSSSYAVSSNGAVVVGQVVDTVSNYAFRWENNVLTDLGTLGEDSAALGVSADGAVVVGYSRLPNYLYRAFRWENGTMANLGTLGGNYSKALAISGNGLVIVGESYADSIGTRRAFRWTQATNMQSVDDWLRASGVSVPTDITYSATATNSDGSVVVGYLDTLQAFIARVVPPGGGTGGTGGSGLITLSDLQTSLGASATGGGMTLAAPGLVINGAHGRPLSRRVATGQSTAWLAGDWGRDDHGARDGDLGLAEVGVGRNFGPVQLNVSLGQTWAKQNLALNGRAKTDGTYLLAEALIPVTNQLWATLGGYAHRGDTELRRAYLNAGLPDRSTGSPDVNTWGLRARLDLDNAVTLAGTGLSPYADLSYSEAKLDAYRETGGAFPVRFDARKDKATELRLGINAVKPLGARVNLLGTLEAAHRFEKTGARTSGEVIGLFGFALDGQKNERDWLRAGVGVEGQLGGGKGSLTINATTKGEAPSYWLAANWQMAF